MSALLYEDYQDSAVPASPSNQSFTKKLFNILDNKDFEDIITWCYGKNEYISLYY